MNKTRFKKRHAQTALTDQALPRDSCAALGHDSLPAARGCIVVGRPVRYTKRWGEETKRLRAHGLWLHRCRSSCTIHKPVGLKKQSGHAHKAFEDQSLPPQLLRSLGVRLATARSAATSLVKAAAKCGDAEWSCTRATWEDTPKLMPDTARAAQRPGGGQVRRRGALLGRAGERISGKLVPAPAHWVKTKNAVCRRLLTSPGAPTRDSCAALWVRPAARAARSTAAAGVAGRDPSREGGGQARRLGAVLQTRQGGDTLEAHARSCPRSPAPTKKRGAVLWTRHGRIRSTVRATVPPTRLQHPPPALSRSARVPCRAHAQGLQRLRHLSREASRPCSSPRAAPSSDGCRTSRSFVERPCPFPRRHGRRCTPQCPGSP